MAAFFSRATSGAVRIVAPGGSGQETPKLCANVAKYGACHFEGIGCKFDHPAREPSRTAVNAAAPVFVPGTDWIRSYTPPSPPPSAPVPTPAPAPAPAAAAAPDPDEHDPYDPYDSHRPPEFFPQGGPFRLPSAPYTPSPDPTPSFFSHRADPPRPPAPFTPPSVPAPFASPQASPAPLPDELQGYHSLVPLEFPNIQSPHSRAHPHRDRDPHPTPRRPTFAAWYSTVYKATSSSDGRPYILRRIENFRLPHESAFAAIEAWARIPHPAIVAVREAFTTTSFADGSLIVAYDYHPNAVTLFDAYLRLPQQQVQTQSRRPHVSLSAPTPPPTAMSHPTPATPGPPIPEPTLWSYTIQLAGAIRAVHAHGLAVRMVDATKVLLTSANRVRIGSCGIADVMAYDARQDVHYLQQEDLHHLGRLLLALSTATPALAAPSPAHANARAAANALEAAGRHYSQEFVGVMAWLVSSAGPGTLHGGKAITTLFEMIGPRLVTEMEGLQQHADQLEGDLLTELENGRLVRLLCKFGFINERPEFDRDPRWSETGDRYIIKLFRDYVFHQVDEQGAPVVNMAHVLTCLNKLDAGTDERIMLISRDEQSCLVVSYKELKTCVESAFGDLSRASR